MLLTIGLFSGELGQLPKLRTLDLDELREAKSYYLPVKRKTWLRVFVSLISGNDCGKFQLLSGGCSMLGVVSGLKEILAKPTVRIHSYLSIR